MTIPASEDSVLFVHGTFAYDENESGKHWWQRGSDFDEALSNRFAGSDSSVSTLPPGDAFAYVAPWWRRLFKRCPAFVPEERRAESVFHWSGDNRESARDNAAALLLQHLKRFDARGPFHVIAHSHGGSILWKALRLATAESSIAPAGTPSASLANLKSWATLGTPFLRLRPVRRDWIRLLALVVFIALLPMQCRWFGDFWAELAGRYRSSIWQVSVSWSLLLLSGLLTGCLVLRLAWSAYHLCEVVAPTKLDAAARRREVDDLWSTVMALTCCAFLSLASYLIVGLPPGFGELASLVSVGCAWIWLMLEVLAALYCLRGFRPLFVARTCKKSRELDARTWATFGARGICIALTSEDEAIGGLSSLTRPLKTRVLPRISSPRSAQFSPSYRHLAKPEKEIARQGFGAWVFQYLLLPVAIFKDWIVSPFYNNVFAELVDRYVLEQTRIRATGIDKPGYTLDEVTAHPLGNSTNEGDHAAVISTAAASELLEAADGGMLEAIRGIRRQLGIDTPLGVNPSTFIQDAMRDAGETSPLVHTSYYRSSSVIEILQQHIRTGQAAFALHKNQRARSETDFIPDRDSLRSRFIAWLMQWTIVILLSAVPVIVPWVFALVTTYQFSREYHLKWASDIDFAVRLANEELNPESRDNISRTPRVVRWWIAYRMAHSENDDVLFGSQLADLRKRSLFFIKVARKHAQLGHAAEATKAFLLARDTIMPLSDNQGLVGFLAGNLYLARIAMGEKWYSGTVDKLTQQTEAVFVGTLNEHLRRAEEEQKSLRPLFEFMQSTPPCRRTTETVVNWCKAPLSPYDQARRVALYANFAPHDQRVQAGLYLLVAEIIAKQLHEPAEEAGAHQLTTCLRALLAVADPKSKPAPSPHALGQIVLAKLLTLQSADPTSVEHWLDAAESLYRSSPYDDDKWSLLEKSHQWTREQSGSRRQERCAAAGAVGYALNEQFTVARKLTAGWGMATHIDVATAMLQNELRRRDDALELTSPIRSRLDEDLIP